jgi:hypothetical protein
MVLRVVNVFPQAQWAVQFWYLGWIFGFIESTPLPGRACGPFLIVFSRRQPGDCFATEKSNRGY